MVRMVDRVSQVCKALELLVFQALLGIALLYVIWLFTVGILNP